MSTYNPGVTVSRKSAVAMTATDYRFVKPAVSDGCNLCGAGEIPMGIRQNSPAQYGMASVVVTGTALLTLGGSVTVGQQIKSDSAGAGVLADTDKDHVGAIALDTGVADDVIEVLVVNYKASI